MKNASVNYQTVHTVLFQVTTITENEDILKQPKILLHFFFKKIVNETESRLSQTIVNETESRLSQTIVNETESRLSQTIVNETESRLSQTIVNETERRIF